MRPSPFWTIIAWYENAAATLSIGLILALVVGAHAAAVLGVLGGAAYLAYLAAKAVFP